MEIPNYKNYSKRRQILQKLQESFTIIAELKAESRDRMLLHEGFDRSDFRWSSDGRFRVYIVMRIQSSDK